MSARVHTALPTRMDARPSTNEELLLGALDNCDVELGRLRDFIGRILAERDALAVELTRAQRRECSSWCCAGTGEHTSFCLRWKALTAAHNQPEKSCERPAETC
jgi:hypothetical protein